MCNMQLGRLFLDFFIEKSEIPMNVTLVNVMCFNKTHIKLLSVVSLSKIKQNLHLTLAASSCQSSKKIEKGSEVEVLCVNPE